MHAARYQGDLHVSVRLGLIVLQDVAFFHKGMKAKRIPKAQSLTAERKTPPCKGGVYVNDDAPICKTHVLLITSVDSGLHVNPAFIMTDGALKITFMPAGMA